jgi:hypothetical protein
MFGDAFAGRLDDGVGVKRNPPPACPITLDSTSSRRSPCWSI